MDIKKYKALIKGILSLVLFFLSSTIQRLFVIILGIKEITNTNAVILNFCGSFTILLCLLYLYKDELKKEWKIFKNKLADNVDIGIKYWLFGLLGMMISNLVLATVFQNDGAENEQLVQQMITALPFLMVISAGFIAPMVEEITFRKVFRDNIKKDILFILVSGIFFGFLHVFPSDNLGQFLYIIPYSSLGISFAIMYQKTNTVFTSISMHMMHNTILTLLSIML